LFKQGFVVHSAVHAARHDIHAILHCHDQYTTAVCMTKHGVLPLSQEALILYNKLSYHPFEGSATDLAERGRMAKSLGPTNKVCMLENHGPVCGGATLAEAFTYMLAITRACEYQCKALATVGGDLTQIHMPEAKLLDEMAARIKFKQDTEPKAANEYNEPKLLCECSHDICTIFDIYSVLFFMI